MADLLTGEGHGVRAATDARSALAMVASRAPRLLLLAARLPDLGGAELLRALRQREREGAMHDAFGAPPPKMVVVLLADAVHEALQRSVADLDVVHLLRKPVSLLDLADLVRRIEASAPVAAASNPVNLARLAGWWARRVTGVLRIDGAGASWVLFANGGPVGSDGMAATLQALRAGTVELEPCDVDGEGDHLGLAHHLWACARGWAAQQPAVDGPLWIVPTAWSASVLDLPLPARTRVALRELDRPASVLQLANKAGNSVAELLLDTRALAAMGLVRTQEHPPDPPTGATPPPSSAPRSTSSFAPDVTTRPTAPTLTASRPRGLPPADAPFSAHPHRQRDTDVDPPTQPVAARFAPTSTTTGRSVGDGGPPPTAPEEVARQIVRLRRELRVVQTAEPWTVLGLPRGTAIELVQRASARMLSRYEPLCSSPFPELAVVAQQHAERIRYAVETIRADGSALGPSEVSLIQAGRALLVREDYAGAERRFSAARALAPGSARALAHLGYARAMNPSLDAKTRADEGLALLELALSFDPASTDALYFLASRAAAAGDPAAADRHLHALFQLQPEHPEGMALAPKVRAQLTQDSGSR